MMKISVPLLVIVLLTGCAGLRPVDTLNASGPVTAYSRAGVAVDRKDEGLVADFVDAYAKSKSATADGKADEATQALRFFNSGVQLVKTNCDEFFRGLGRARQDQSFTTRTIASAGAVAGTVSGITGASAKTLALIAAGVTGSLASLEIYGDEYLFAPDVAAVQTLIHTAQAEFLKQVDEKGIAGTLNFYSAHGLIQELQNYCEVQTIRGYVTAAIKAGKFAPSSTENQDRLRAMVNTEGLAAVSRIAGRPLRAEEVVLLYWYYVLGSSGANRANSDKIAALVTALDSTAVKAGDFRFAFAALPANARQSIEVDIETLRKAAAVPTGAAIEAAVNISPTNAAGRRAGLPVRINLQIMQ